MTWLIHMCEIESPPVQRCLHSNVCHDLYICVTWLIHICDKAQSNVWHDTHEPPTVQRCLYSNVRHDWFICVSRLAHMCDMAHQVHMCHMTQANVWHDACICVCTNLNRLAGPDLKCVTGIIQKHIRACQCWQMGVSKCDNHFNFM